MQSFTRETVTSPMREDPSANAPTNMPVIPTAVAPTARMGRPSPLPSDFNHIGIQKPETNKSKHTAMFYMCACRRFTTPNQQAVIHQCNCPETTAKIKLPGAFTSIWGSPAKRGIPVFVNLPETAQPLLPSCAQEEKHAVAQALVIP